jgi:hypothetical protein
MPAMSIYTPQLIFYVYAYLRIDGSPYYIGKGKGKRMFDKRHTVAVPEKQYIVVLENNLTEIGAIALERRYIRWHGRLDLNTGILENRTDGGEGLSGHIQSEEHKSKRKLFEKGNQIGKLNKGIKKSDSHIEKMRINNTGKVMSLESSEKKRLAMLGKTGPNKGKKLTNEWKENMSKASKGKPKSNEHKKNLAKHLNSLPKVTCPHCGKEGRMAPMKYWHFDRCKMVNNQKVLAIVL